jgi:hypothetical protein
LDAERAAFTDGVTVDDDKHAFCLRRLVSVVDDLGLTAAHTAECSDRASGAPAVVMGLQVRL